MRNSFITNAIKAILAVTLLCPLSALAQFDDPPPPEIDYSKTSTPKTAFDQLVAQRGNCVIGIRQGKYGLVKGKTLVLPFEYRKLAFSDNTPFLMACNEQIRYGLLDTNGKVILPFEWQQIRDFYQQNRILAQKGLGSKSVVQLISTQGQVLHTLSCKDLSPIGDGRYIASKDSTELLKTYVAILDSNFQMMCPFKYNHFGWVSGDWAFAIHYGLGISGLLRISDGFFQPLPPTYSSIGPPDENGNLFFNIGSMETRPRIGLMNTAMKVLVQPVYWNSFHIAHTQQYFFRDETNWFALFDPQGNQLSGFTYAYPQRIYSNLRDKYGAQIERPFSILWQINTSKKSLIHDQKGRIIGDSCEQIQVLNDSLFFYSVGQKFTLRSLNGQVLLSDMDDMAPFLNGFMLTRKGKTVALRHENGQLVREIDAETLPKQYQGKEGTFYFAKKNDAYGVLNADLKPITPYQFGNLDWQYIPANWLEKHKDNIWIASGYLVNGTQRMAVDHLGNIVPIVD